MKCILHDWMRTDVWDITLYDVKQTLGACTRLPLDNKQAGTTPVSSCPPLWTGLVRSGRQRALKDTQSFHHTDFGYKPYTVSYLVRAPSPFSTSLLKVAPWVQK